MSKKRKKPSKKKIGDFLPSSEERDNALEEYGSCLGSFCDLFDEEDDDDDED